MPQQRRTASSRSAGKKKPAPRKPAKAPAKKPVKSSKRPAHPAAKAKPAGTRAAAAKKSRPSERPAGGNSKPVRSIARAKPAPAGPAPSASPSREQAVETFERGFRALQQRQFDQAARALTAILRNFPEEKELQDRARVYLSICERQAGAAAGPRSFEDRLNAATIAINRGAVAEAVRLLRELEGERRDSDHVQYLLCVALTGAGDAPGALEHLRRAVELNPENRSLSVVDADLEALRQHAGFAAALASPQPGRRPGARRR